MLGICPTAAPVNAADSDYKYVYASLDWAEYWQNENVYLASGSTLKSSSEERSQMENMIKVHLTL